MSINNPKIERYSDTHVFGTAQLTHQAGTDVVLFVAPRPAEFDPHAAPALDHNARYFASPLVARTHWEDCEKGVSSVPSFTGRDENAMETYLAINHK